MICLDGAVYQTARVHEYGSLQNDISTDRTQNLYDPGAFHFAIDQISGADNGIRAILHFYHRLSIGGCIHVDIALVEGAIRDKYSRRCNIAFHPTARFDLEQLGYVNIAQDYASYVNR